MFDINDYGPTIRELRRKRGLTQGQLAELAHVSRPTISKLEESSETAKLSTLQAVLRALGFEMRLVPVMWKPIEPLPEDDYWEMAREAVASYASTGQEARNALYAS